MRSTTRRHAATRKILNLKSRTKQYNRIKLTFEEQAYHDEFVKVYNRYGDKIPDNEWLRLSTLREGLNVSFQQSRKIIEIVELES